MRSAYYAIYTNNIPQVITNERYSRGHCTGQGKMMFLTSPSAPNFDIKSTASFLSDLSKVLKEGLESIFYGTF